MAAQAAPAVEFAGSQAEVLAAAAVAAHNPFPGGEVRTEEIRKRSGAVDGTVIKLGRDKRDIGSLQNMSAMRV